MSNRRGILYEGPSQLDGQPIVAIAVYSGDNKKTGAMVQTFILRADQSPVDAVRSGADASICGSCPHRGNGFAGRSCYVNVGQAPGSVWRAWKRGSYRVLAPSGAAALGAGVPVRLGSYGDPAAVPLEVWRALVSRAAGWSGYTHQWRHLNNWGDLETGWRELFMASCDSATDALEARETGWRPFRVRLADEPLLPKEFTCPASEEAGKKLQCVQCRSCGGANGQTGSPAIIAHGALAIYFRSHK